MSQEHTKLRYNRIPFHDAAGEDVLQRVEKHWENMRRLGPVPAQLALSPETLDSALSHCFVLERIGSTIARFRVAGQALTQLMGMDARAMPLGALFTSEARQKLGPLIKTACEGPEIVEIPVTSPRGLGRSALRGRVLLLPLKDRDGDVSRIFGCVVVDASPRRRALRFDIDPQVLLRCKRLTPALETMTQVADRIAETANARIPVDLTPSLRKERPTPEPKRQHLRLVVDNG